MTPLPHPAPPRHILDTEEGLERVMGERALYLQLLRRFRDDYSDTAARLAELLACHEHGNARRLTHSLKGSAGLIGAQQVHDQALEVERCVAAGDDVLPQLQALEKSQQALAIDIDRQLADAGEAAAMLPQLPTDQATLRALLDKLTHLLQAGDGAAIDLMEQSAPVLAGALGVPTFQLVAAATYAYDFEGALDALGTEL
jgi:HPt (histidine-containing phosphotransfer) domain-containing protein